MMCTKLLCLVLFLVTVMADFKAKYLLMNVEVILKHFTFHDTQFITSIWLRHVISLSHHHHHHLFCYRDVGVLCSIRITLPFSLAVF